MRFYVDVVGAGDNSPAMNDIHVSYHLTGDVNAADFADGTFDNEGNLSSSDRALEYDDDTGRYYVHLDVKGDTQIEANERFVFHLDEANNVGNSGGAVEIAQGGVTADGMIQGDDYGLQIVTANLEQAEDKARFVFEVLRSGPTDEGMEINWRVGVPDATADGDGVSANDFIDPTTGHPFTDQPTGTLSFAAGETTMRFTLEAAHDFTAENDERFCVLASVIQIGDTEIDSGDAPENLFAYTEGTIINDDGAVPDNYVPPAMLEPIHDPHAVG